MTSAALSPTLAEDAKVFFLEPKDGSTVASPVKAAFGLEGMTVAPAGSMEPGTGHHHVLVDAEALPEGEVITVGPQNLHYGKGQTGAEIPLAPGKHKLTLQFGDGVHKSFGPKLSHTISVTVKDEGKGSIPRSAKKASSY